MRKNIVLAGVITVCAVGMGIYHYVNHKAAAVIGEQIAVINSSYASMAEQGLMPAVVIGYKNIDVNYWLDDYQLNGMTVDVAGVGTIANIAHIRVQDFQPGKLAETGSVSIEGLQLAAGMQLLLPTAWADISSKVALSSEYRYQYLPQSGELVLQQDVKLGEQFTLQYQLTLQQMQALWQVAQKLTAMDAAAQRSYSQSAEYQAELKQALAQGVLVKGELELTNQQLIQQVYKALGTMEYTAPLATLKPRFEQYLAADTALPDTIKAALLTFLAEPRYLKLQFEFTEPLSFAQLQDETFRAEQLATPQQIVAFSQLQLTVNPAP